MGQCYENEQLGMEAAAIRCYRRALVNQDPEGIALHKLVGPLTRRTSFSTSVLNRSESVSACSLATTYP